MQLQTSAISYGKEMMAQSADTRDQKLKQRAVQNHSQTVGQSPVRELAACCLAVFLNCH